MSHNFGTSQIIALKKIQKVNDGYINKQNSIYLEWNTILLFMIYELDFT